jgi:glycosyltransferase involved in cell wall biosynthesis
MFDLQRSDGLSELFVRVRALCRDLQPHAVHIQYIAPALVPVVAARSAGVPLVFATVHQPGERFGLLPKVMLRTAARMCTAFFCVSRAVEESWFGDSAIFAPDLAARGRRHFTIYNGVAIPATAEAKAPMNEDLKGRLGLEDKRVIGIVGRLSGEKGHAILFDALQRVIAAVPESRLLVVGDGPEQGALFDQVRRLGIERHVLWMGEQTPAEVQGLYRVMDVVAMPSRFEGFGLAVAEAMAAGCPTVSTGVGGLSELVEDGVTGYLVPPDDAEALATALVSALRDRPLAVNMGARGKARAVAHFSAERFAAIVGAAYEHYWSKEGH